MTNEQEVIERLKYDISAGEYSTIKTEVLETVLNMLKEKDRQINSKNGTINALQCALKERTEERDRKDDIVTNQNKILDLMTETIRKLAIALANYKGSYDKETINLTSNTEEIKQYFERKSNEI